MSWPLSQDYNEAIQSTARNFVDADLRGGKAVTNALGLPTPCSGNFADVYQVRCPNGSRWAVKCFTREAPGLRERYQEISRHLRGVKLPFTVDFEYLDQGIRVAGRWYPVLKMQWVEGLTLNQFVAKNVDKPATLEALLQIWARMARHLRASGAAHGDLQHGNVLLVPDPGGKSLALKLVDYDGMFVPALAGRPSGEVGHAAYQHPQRTREQTYSLEVDRFPVLLVATALSALKAGGRALWEKYDDGDNLLFTREDLETPSKSRLFYELLKLDDPAARSLAETLIDAARKPLDETPLLEELLLKERPAAASSAEPAPSPHAEVAGVVDATAQAAGGLADDDFQSERRRRNATALRIAGGAGAAMALLAVLIGVVALVANHGADDTGKGQALVRGDSRANKTSNQQVRSRDVVLETNRPLPTEKETPPLSTKRETPPIPATWKSLANMPTARSLLAAVTDPDGRIYAIGGENASGHLDTVEVFDPSTNKWTTVASMPTARLHLATTMGPDNHIYAIGGVSGVPNIVEAYNPSTNKWTTVAPMPTARHGLAAVTGPDGRIYAIGGNGSNGSLNTVEAYDTKSDTWTTVASMPTARVYLAAAMGPDGRIYAIGGFQEGDGKRLNTVEAYDTKTNKWTPVASMSTARNALAAATGRDGRIYAIGGHVDGGIIKTVEAYDPSTNKWATVASMPTVRGELAAATGRDGRIYAIGGGDLTFLNTVEALSVSTSKP